jgi:N-acetylglucosaminyldiphosphoundecaprenol N-acetyl-beta-D-mannosaminyltransferase
MTAACPVAEAALESREILGVRVDVSTYEEAASWILRWARARRSCYVCCAPVSLIMQARRSRKDHDVLRQAALVTADGMPLVWMLRAMGVKKATRVYGPELTPLLLDVAAGTGISVGFLGGTREVLDRLREIVQRRFPGLNVGYAEAPPFRQATPGEDERLTHAIQASGVRILFVGLGNPKQERWMHARLGRIDAVMIGVGAAFDFLAGAKAQAPRWMQRAGLEWLFRLCHEPRRLWRRYLFNNPAFAALAISQLLRDRFL